MQPAVPPSSPPFPFSYRPSPPFSFSPRVASTFYRQLYRRKKGLTHILLFPTLWGEGINSLLLSRARCSITFTIGLLRFAPPIFVTNLSARDEGNREREREWKKSVGCLLLVNVSRFSLRICCLRRRFLPYCTRIIKRYSLSPRNPLTLYSFVERDRQGMRRGREKQREREREIEADGLSSVAEHS